MMKLLLIMFLSLEMLAQTPIEKATQLFQEKKYPEASKILNSIKSDHPSFADAQFYLGRISYQEQKWEEAIDYLEKAIESNGKNAEYYFWLGNSLGSYAQEANVFKQGYLAPKVKSAFEKSVELDPKHTGSLHGLVSFYTQAPGVMGGSYERAHACADKIKQLKYTEGCRAKAGIYVKQENFQGAEKEWKAAVQSDERMLPGLVNFYTSQKKYESAFQLLESALKKNPNNMGNMYQFGKTSALSGQRLDEGQTYLLKYLNHNPTENEPSLAGANMRLAQIWEKKGNKAEAKMYFEKATQQDPNLKEAKEGLARVK